MKQQATFDVDTAKRMRAEGYYTKTIAEAMGVSATTIRLHTDTEFRARQNALKCKRRATTTSPVVHVVSRTSKDDIAARLAEIPKDTRTPAQILCGDPIPSRSALAQWTARNQ